MAKKYIDADRLREMIAKQMESLPREVGRGAGTITPKGYGMMQAFQIMRSIIDSLQQEQPEAKLEKELQLFLRNYDYEFDDDAPAYDIAKHFYELGLKARKGEQEQQEVNLEEFTEKMDAWKARFNRSDDIPIKATMAFTARMFYQYPDVARQWYEQLPKATMD